MFAGTVISLGFFALVSSLWLATAYSDPDGSGWITGNLAWFLGGTAVVSLFLAGLLAGFLSGIRGAKSGLLNGLTAWGLLFVARPDGHHHPPRRGYEHHRRGGRSGRWRCERGERCVDDLLVAADRRRRGGTRRYRGRSGQARC